MASLIPLGRWITLWLCTVGVWASELSGRCTFAEAERLTWVVLIGAGVLALPEAGALLKAGGIASAALTGAALAAKASKGGTDDRSNGDPPDR